MTVKLECQLSGQYVIKKWSATGELLQELGPFSNLITNTGLENIGSMEYGNMLTSCWVGTGTTPPAFTNTALVNTLSPEVPIYQMAQSNSGTPDYFGQLGLTFRFTPGQATGNLTEVGVGTNWFNGVDYEQKLFSRALIVDEFGNPLTITVLADEYLDVTYILRYYPPLNTGSGSFNISGVTYNYTARLAQAANTGVGYNPVLNFSGILAWEPSVVPSTATLGDITDQLVNVSNSDMSADVTRQAYVSNSKSITYSCRWALDQANFTNQIIGFLVMWGSSGNFFSVTFQVLLDKRINKTASKVLVLNVALAWSRKS